jgi:ligand-binding SRPBCC domain-containing protein
LVKIGGIYKHSPPFSSCVFDFSTVNKKAMPVYTLETKQILPASIDEVWNFISSPKNLKEITPAYMGFDITSNNVDRDMYPGMMISYLVSPMLGLKMKWVTEITHVQEKQYFVDEQRVGPYKIWHHQHHIKQIAEGVEMIDIVNYCPPFGFIGSIANTIMIKNKLKEIFEYRRVKLESIFGTIS